MVNDEEQHGLWPVFADVPTPRASVIRTRHPRRFNWTRPSSAESKELTKNLLHPSIRGDHRGRAHYWCEGGPVTVPRSRSTSRSAGESSQRQRRSRGCLPGVVPLVLKTPPESTVAEFCQHVDSCIRELLQHQRFPVHTLEGDGGLGGPRQASNRVAVNFIPGRLTLDLAGAPATATYTNHGPVGHFGLFFLGASDQLFLSTAGAGQPFANFEVSDLAERLQQVLMAMTAMSEGSSSVDGCCRWMCLTPVSMTGWMGGAIGRC